MPRDTTGEVVRTTSTRRRTANASTTTTTSTASTPSTATGTGTTTAAMAIAAMTNAARRVGLIGWDSSGKGHSRDGSFQGVGGAVALEFGFGVQQQPMAQDRRRDADDVVGRDVITIGEARH